MGSRDALFSAIMVSFLQGHAAAAAVGALILQGGLRQGPNAAPVSEQCGFHYRTGAKDAGEGTWVLFCTLSWAHDL